MSSTKCFVLHHCRCQHIFVLFVYVALCLAAVASAERVEILMSNVTTQKEDAYMCTSYKLADDQQYITNIQPLTTADIAHHMFAFGCEKPASSQNAWNCESLVCQGPKTILFAWGRNAPELKLPDDVAFKVGEKTSYKYIVVNIHYLAKVNNDRSGLAITVSNSPRKYQAGIMLMVANYINIPPNTKKYSTPFSCKYEGKNIQVFAFRVHAHVHGDVNSAYRVRDHEWMPLARGDPQWPQAFYPIVGPTNQVEVRDQDALIGVCTYHNDESRNVYAGSTHNDEMCNIYLMYYADSIDGVMDVCSGSTYPALETIIPDEAFIKPPAMNGNDKSDSKANSYNSHHDMEGSKLHHDISVLDKPSKDSKYSQSDKSLSDLLSSLGGGSSGAAINDDYYDDIEQQRSKTRGSSSSKDTIYNADNSVGFDPAALLDSVSSSSSASGDDYTDASFMLAAELAKQLGKNSFDTDLSSSGGRGGSSNTKNRFLDKVKEKLSSFIPQTISISKYTLIDKWYDPKVIKLGQIGGIEVNQKTDTLVVFHRGSQIWQSDSFNGDYRFNTRKYTTIPVDTIITINRSTGKLVSSWGANQFLMPHGLTLDSEGNIWVTDVGRHQVLKIDANTHETLLEIGERLVPGSDRAHFCQPADVAVLKNGEFFVADGYCNSRIVKFSKQGAYITEWSSEDERMPTHFFVPHSLALNEAANLLCVADRENFRVQCFDLNGNFLEQSLANEVGPIYAVSFAQSNSSVLYAVNGYNSQADTQFDKKIYLVSTKNGQLLGAINLAPEIRTPHDLALSDDASEIYIANLNPSGVYKYSLVNYNFNKITGDKKNPKGSKNEPNDKESMQTSLIIMGFLVVPLVVAIIVASIVRLKNMNKLRRLNLSANGVGGGIESRWKKRKAPETTKNGFTRLNQESDVEESQSLNNPNSTRGDSDEEDTSEVDASHMPGMSKA